MCGGGGEGCVCVCVRVRVCVSARARVCGGGVVVMGAEVVETLKFNVVTVRKA